MIVIEFEFPVKKDAYIFRDMVNKFFNGSFFEKEKQFSLDPITKKDNKDRNIWSFKLIFHKNETDTISIEKYTKISGGTLDLINGTKQVWAFA